MWDIDLGRHTARSNGFVVKFNERRIHADLSADCFCDSNGTIWKAVVDPTSVYIGNEAQRMRLTYEAVDAYQIAARAAIDPFPLE